MLRHFKLVIDVGFNVIITLTNPTPRHTSSVQLYDHGLTSKFTQILGQKLLAGLSWSINSVKNFFKSKPRKTMEIFNSTVVIITKNFFKSRLRKQFESFPLRNSNSRTIDIPPLQLPPSPLYRSPQFSLVRFISLSFATLPRWIHVFLISSPFIWPMFVSQMLPRYELSVYVTHFMARSNFFW